LKIGLRGCLETAVANYQSAFRDIPQERICHLHSGGKSEIKQAMNTFKYFYVLELNSESKT